MHRERAAGAVELTISGRPTRGTTAALPWLPIVLALSIVGTFPFFVSDFWLSVFNYAGVAAIGAIGLNLLTGNTGQVSLGQPFFMGIGCYSAAYFGADLGLPFPLWLIATALIGAIVGGLVGPFALRLRGHYLVMVTLGLVMIGLHVWQNWHGLSGGANGRPIILSVAIGPVDFNRVPGMTRNQSWFWLIWVFVLAAVLVSTNILRTRSGRALMAVRDREMTAAVIGINVAEAKIKAFVVSSLLAAIGGALYGGYVRYANPVEWDLLLGVQYLAMIVVGGTGSVVGSVLGAIFITATPHVVKLASPFLPLVATQPGAPGLSVFALNQAIFGLLIVGFLMFEPRGLSGFARAVFKRLRRMPQQQDFDPSGRTTR